MSAQLSAFLHEATKVLEAHDAFVGSAIVAFVFRVSS
jgi:hypothetical protein